MPEHSESEKAYGRRFTPSFSDGDFTVDLRTMSVCENRDELLLFTDGASRGNPGPAAIAYRIVAPDTSVVTEHGERIGTATNNQAEYRALISGLRACAAFTVGRVRCGMDSEVVVKQLNGEYRTKEPELAALRAEVKEAAAAFAEVEYNHWPRSHPDITRTDALANRALDASPP